ncbi:11002_t:CDS:2, partial [Paraglomus brasilianum]
HPKQTQEQEDVAQEGEMLETEVPVATLTLMPNRRDIHASTQIPTLELPTEARNQEDLFKRSCVYAKKNRNNFNMKKLQQKLSDHSRDRLSETRCIAETETQDIVHSNENLRSLDLSNNQITELPCQLATKLSAIETIDVCNNPLATSQIDLVYVSSGVPSLSDLVFRYLVNKDYRFINSKNGELPNVIGSLPSVLKERLINEWHPICAACDSVHLEPVATMRLLKWICLVPNVPLRYDLCSVRCARKMKVEIEKEREDVKERLKRRRERFGIGVGTGESGEYGEWE